MMQHPLKRWRTTRSQPLTLREVAAAAGIDHTSLCKVETGRRDRLSRDAYRRLLGAYPGELDRDELESWSWSRVRRSSRRTKPTAT